jgi:phosphotriesterase-related protein
MRHVQTTGGPVPLEELGRTLIHEHVFCAMPGWQFDHRAPRFVREDAICEVVDKLQELRAYGCRTIVDPCPMDIGRDVAFVAEVQQRSGVRIVCATGVYGEAESGLYTLQWLPREQLVELYVKELMEGVGDTGIRCGVIKIATGAGPATEYERRMMGVAAEAAQITGAPVISHTPMATHGHEQIDVVEAHGLPARCLVVGHCGDRDDPDYQASIAARGAFVGLDRFGMEEMLPDAVRMKNLLQLVRAGHRDRVLVSHDCVMCMRGRFPPPYEEVKLNDISRFLRDLAPQLLQMGLSAEDLDHILIENPRALFANAAAHAVGAARSAERAPA